MASSRDVLNAFRAHVARLAGDGELASARDAWADFLANVAPSFPAEHREEARRAFEAFAREHGAATGSPPERS